MAPSITILNTSITKPSGKLLPGTFAASSNSPCRGAGGTFSLSGTSRAADSFFLFQFSEFSLRGFGSLLPHGSTFLDSPGLILSRSPLLHEFAILHSKIVPPFLEHGDDFMWW
jgi:hypothetical protein